MIRLLALLLLCGCPESISVADRNDGGPNPGGDGGSGPGGCSPDFRNRVSVRSPTGDARFFEIRAVRFDAARRLYVLNREAGVGYVTVLSPAPEHELIRSYGRADLGFVRDMAVAADGTAFVAQWANAGDTPVIHRFGPDGSHQDRFEVTEPNGQNDQALSVAIDEQNVLYVGGLVLFRYRTDGTFIDFFGREGPNPGEVLLPIGLAWDPGGYLWVADLFRNTIHQFDLATRTQSLEFGGRGDELGSFDGTAPDGEYWGPTRIVLDSNGDIYVNDPWSSRLQKFDRFGGSLGGYSFGGSREIDGALAVEPARGHLYVGRGNSIDVICPF